MTRRTSLFALTITTCFFLLQLILNTVKVVTNVPAPVSTSQPMNVSNITSCPANDQTKLPVVDDKKWDNVRTKAETGVDHPNQDVQNLLDSVMVNGKLLLTAANYAHLNFVLNWVESLKRNVKNEKNFLVVCFDDDLLTEMEIRHIPALSIKKLFDLNLLDQPIAQEDVQKEQIYGTESYNRFVNTKIDVVYVILRYYNLRFIVFSDVDLVMTNLLIMDLIDYYVARRKYDIVTTDSHDDDFYPCTGFYAVTKSDISLRFLGSILEYSEKKKTHDQLIGTSVYNNLPPNLQMRFYALPRYLFNDGNSVNFPESFGFKPWVFHANYRIGYHDKKKLLNDLGYWYLD